MRSEEWFYIKIEPFFIETSKEAAEMLNYEAANRKLNNETPESAINVKEGNGGELKNVGRNG